MMKALQPPFDVSNSFQNQSLTATAVNILVGAGTIENYDFFNSGGDSRFVKMFNCAAADVVLGTTVPRFIHGLAAGGGIGKSYPTYWPNGCSVIATVERTLAGNTAASANEVGGNALPTKRTS